MYLYSLLKEIRSCLDVVFFYSSVFFFTYTLAGSLMFFPGGYQVKFFLITICTAITQFNLIFLTWFTNRARVDTGF
jgi:hypothetical protein